MYSIMYSKKMAGGATDREPTASIGVSRTAGQNR